MSYTEPTYVALSKMSRDKLIEGFDKVSQGGINVRSEMYLNEIHHKDAESLSGKMFWLTVANVLLAAASAAFVIMSAFEVV